MDAADEAGVDVKHIPYKGTGAMVTDLLGGQVELGFVALPSIQGHLKSGALRAIGVGGTARSPAATGRLTATLGAGMVSHQAA